MPRRGRRRTKSRTHVDDTKHLQAKTALKGAAAAGVAGGGKDVAAVNVPRSIVFRRGKHSEAEVGELVQDVRNLMAPYTALHLQENRQLSISQYAKHLAIPMGVSHMLAFSQNDERLWLKIVKTPDGPTLTFRVLQFTLHKHIAKTQKRPVALNTPAIRSAPPLVVTNNFESSAVTTASTSGSSPSQPHLKLMRITFQNMFPPTNVATVSLKECRRVALFQYDSTQDVVLLRHYAVSTSPVGVNRRVKRLVGAASASSSAAAKGGGKLPNLGKLADIADYLDPQAGYVSETASVASSSAYNSDSDIGDDLDGTSSNTVRLPDRFLRAASSKGSSLPALSAIKLKEIGPRLTLRLVKVEKGMAGGDVLYHALAPKTPEEAAELKLRKDKERQLKIQRQAEQQRNVDKKRAAAHEKKQRREANRKRQKTDGNQDDQVDDQDDDEDQDGFGSDAGTDVEA